MSSGGIRVAGILVFVSLALSVVANIVAFATMGAMMTGDNPNPMAALTGMMTGAGIISIIVGIFALVVFFLAMSALKSYLTKYANYTGANGIISAIIWTFAALLVIYVIFAFATMGGNPQQAGVLGGIMGILMLIIMLVLYILYFIKAFKLSAYAKANQDGAVRGYAILLLIVCWSLIGMIVVSILGAVAPALFILVAIVGIIVVLILIAVWVMLGVALVSGASKMKAKGM
ncbi:MAG: hypothetical protein AB7P50_19000 [Alphaproteobacteria bacterium]